MGVLNKFKNIFDSNSKNKNKKTNISLLRSVASQFNNSLTEITNSHTDIKYKKLNDEEVKSELNLKNIYVSRKILLAGQLENGKFLFPNEFLEKLIPICKEPQKDKIDGLEQIDIIETLTSMLISGCLRFFAINTDLEIPQIEEVALTLERSNSADDYEGFIFVRYRLGSLGEFFILWPQDYFRTIEKLFDSEEIKQLLKVNEGKNIMLFDLEAKIKILHPENFYLGKLFLPDKTIIDKRYTEYIPNELSTAGFSVQRGGKCVNISIAEKSWSVIYYFYNPGASDSMVEHIKSSVRNLNVFFPKLKAKVGPVLENFKLKFSLEIKYKIKIKGIGKTQLIAVLFPEDFLNYLFLLFLPDTLMALVKKNPFNILLTAITWSHNSSFKMGLKSAEIWQAPENSSITADCFSLWQYISFLPKSEIRKVTQCLFGRIGALPTLFALHADNVSMFNKVPNEEETSQAGIVIDARRIYIISRGVFSLNKTEQPIVQFWANSTNIPLKGDAGTFIHFLINEDEAKKANRSAMETLYKSMQENSINLNKSSRSILGLCFRNKEEDKYQINFFERRREIFIKMENDQLLIRSFLESSGYQSLKIIPLYIDANELPAMSKILSKILGARKWKVVTLEAELYKNKILENKASWQDALRAVDQLNSYYEDIL